MGRVLRTALLLAALLAVGAAPAHGAGWAWPLGSTVALRFGETWTDARGTACVHGGIDIPAEPGAAVSACAGGRVAFCGPVPSASGGRVLALSVETAEGLRVTYMPLAQARVSSGDPVSSGEVVGTLAGEGDGSWPASHLHLSVKRGDSPLDPEPLLVAQAGPADAPSAAGPPPAAPSDPAPAAVGETPVPRSAVGAVAPRASVAPAGALAPCPALRVPVPSGSGRWAVQAPRRAPLRMPEPSLRVPVLRHAVGGPALRLAAALAAALAVWALAKRRSQVAMVRSRPWRTDT